VAPNAAIVLVPGLGLSGDAVDPLARELAAFGTPGFDVTLGLLPSYGLPARRPADRTPRVLALRLLAELDTADRGPVVLVGHSSSCQVVVEAALAAPSRVAGLVLIGPTTDPRASTWPRLILRWLRTAGWERPWQVPLLVRDYVRAGVPGLLRTMDLARRHRIDVALSSVRCPVRVVRGPHDRIAPESWTRELAAVSGGTSQTIGVGAHMVPLTHPRLVAEQIRLLVSATDGEPHVVADPEAG